MEVDEIFGVRDVKACVNLLGKFFILANQRFKNKGVFLLQIDENNWDKIEELGDENENDSFLIKWEHKLDIDDVDLYVKEDQMRESCFKEGAHSEKTIDIFKNELKHKFFSGLMGPKSKELILSFKSIYKNTYDIFVMDLDSRTFVFKYQIFHLWERTIKGFYLFHSNNFLTISETGTFAQSLTQRNKHIIFKDIEKQGIHRTLHSLQMCDHLKINESNHILFRENPEKN